MAFDWKWELSLNCSFQSSVTNPHIFGRESDSGNGEASRLVKRHHQAIELTLEQDLSLRNFADMVQQMSHKQAQEFLVEQQRLMMLQKTIYQEILKHEWKLDSDFTTR